MTDRFTVTWHDRFREPKCPPNPIYPDGVTIDLREDGEGEGCQLPLHPYPAPRCGWFEVHCHQCGVTVGCTTAGRPDDPRVIIVPCKKGIA
jgi:hypothetical protein